MSRIGKQVINIPADVEVKIDGSFIVVKGPKGQLKQELHPKISVMAENNEVRVKVANEQEKSQRALWGLFGSLIKNMIIGVTQGYNKQLAISGVGFTSAVSGKKLILKVGFSHPVEYQIPEGIEIKSENNIITISGIDKQLVGEAAAQIRQIKKPEPYKGKGIKYIEEKIRRKAGKAAAAVVKTQ